MESIKDTIKEIIEGVFDKNGVWNFAAATLMFLAITIITVVLFITLPLWILPAWLARRNTPEREWRKNMRKYKTVFAVCETEESATKLAKQLEDHIRSFCLGTDTYRAMITCYHNRMRQLIKAK